MSGIKMKGPAIGGANRGVTSSAPTTNTSPAKATTGTHGGTYGGTNGNNTIVQNHNAVSTAVNWGSSGIPGSTWGDDGIDGSTWGNDGIDGSTWGQSAGGFTKPPNQTPVGVPPPTNHKGEGDQIGGGNRPQNNANDFIKPTLSLADQTATMHKEMYQDYLDRFSWAESAVMKLADKNNNLTANLQRSGAHGASAWKVSQNERDARMAKYGLTTKRDHSDDQLDKTQMQLGLNNQARQNADNLATAAGGI